MIVPVLFGLFGRCACRELLTRLSCSVCSAWVLEGLTTGCSCWAHHRCGQLQQCLQRWPQPQRWDDEAAAIFGVERARVSLTVCGTRLLLLVLPFYSRSPPRWQSTMFWWALSWSSASCIVCTLDTLYYHESFTIRDSRKHNVSCRTTGDVLLRCRRYNL